MVQFVDQVTTLVQETDPSSTVSAGTLSRFRVLKDILGYSASSLFAQAVGLASGFWIARLLGPTDFGVWNALGLVLAYGVYVDFGVLSAMGRDLPYSLGRSDWDKAAELENAAMWAAVAGALLVGVVITIVSFRAGTPPIVRVGLRCMALTLLLQQMYAYHRTVLRSHNEFSALSQQQVWLSLMTAGFALAGVVWFGLRGRMIAAILAQAAILPIALRRHPWRSVGRPPLSAAWSLMRIGVPITVSGSVLTLVATIDRPMVIAFLGEKQLGYFGLALLLTAVVSLVPSMASQVLYPRITYRFGESGRDIAALRSFVLQPPLMLACLLPAVIGPVYLVLPAAIGLFLPAYAPAIVATRIVLIGTFFSAVLGVADYFLVTTGRLKQYAVFGCVTLALNVVLDYVVLRLGYGIEGIAFVGTPLTYFFYSSIVIGYALSQYSRSPAEWCRYFGRLWLPFMYMLALLWMIDRVTSYLVPPTTRIGVAAAVCVEVAVYLAAVAPLVLYAARELSFGLSWPSLFRHAPAR